MENNDFNNLDTLLEAKKFLQLREMFSQFFPADIAFYMEELPQKQLTQVFRTLPKETATEVFAELPGDVQASIITSITDNEIADIIEDLFVDDAVDFLEELPATVVKRVLKNAKPETRALINQFLQYPENSAGSIMTSEYIDVHQNMTVAEAFTRIRRQAIDKETIYTCYVTDANRLLEGIVTIKTLLLAADTDLIGDIMETDIIRATTSDDQEEVARLFSKYGLLSVPVVDHENRLVGIVTVDDAVDVMQQETTEDFELMASMHPSEKPYLKTGVFTLARHRIVWLLILMISATLTGTILSKYEAAFAILPVLVTFIPMITNTGGNAGSQSSTLIIRGIAVSEIKTKDALRILWKELRVSIVVGVVLSGVNFLRLFILHPDQIMISLTVAISLLMTVIAAKTVGSMLPLIAKKFHLDPAIMAAPLITTIVDALSLVMYLGIAQRLLHF